MKPAESTLHPAIASIVIVLVATAPALGGTAAPDTIEYTVQDGDTLVKICAAHRQLTDHYSLTELMTAIRDASRLSSDALSIGQQLRIPLLAEREEPRVAEPVKAGHEVRAIYLTGPACGVSSLFDRVDAFIGAGGNAVVFDAKDIDGAVSYRSAHPLAAWGEGRAAPVIPSLDDMMARFRRRGLYVIARIALFLDGELGRNHPELALQDSTGAAWSERGCAWIDPENPVVRDYNLTLAVELARAGVDEIQFDYVRYPTNGWRGDWAGDLEGTAARRRTAISGFLAAAREQLSGHRVVISADLFGIMAWGRVDDLALTGQHVPTIASLVDVICPMIYPSHFRPGFDGIRQPGDDPAYFIGEGTRRFRELVAGQARIRPWLQAFPYLVTAYDGEYIATQVRSSRAAGGDGWSLWNPSCNYNAALTVLPSLVGSQLAAAPPPAAPAPRPATRTGLRPRSGGRTGITGMVNERSRSDLRHQPPRRDDRP